MGGLFGVVSSNDCVQTLFYGTDYHSHLGTENGGMAVLGSKGFQKAIHSISQAQSERYDQSISAGTVRTLLLGKDMDIDKIKLIALSDSLVMESRNILIGFISHVLEREVKSLKVMEQVRKLCL